MNLREQFEQETGETSYWYHDSYPHRDNPNYVEWLEQHNKEQGWISVDDELPELEVPIWIYVNGRILMGCRSNYAGEGWVWCRLYDMPFYMKHRDDKWDFEPYSDDDYQPTHWKPLPKPPTQ